VPGTEARSWYLAPGGGLTDEAPDEPQADGFTWDADALPPTDFTGDTGSGEGGLWTATPDYEWEQNPSGSAVSYLTEPLAEDTAVIGAGAVEVWVRSSAPSVDLQATISEVRPDGKETFVQNGWVRGDMRKLDAAKSSPLEPVLSLRESDASPLPADEFTEVTIPLYYEGHAYRAGSRIRVTIAAPNGTQPIWAFAQTQPEGTAEVAIAYGGEMSSRLLLPVVPGVEPTSDLPPCPGLRGEPCREYAAFSNRAADLEAPPGGGEPPGGEPPAGGGGTPGSGGGSSTPGTSPSAGGGSAGSPAAGATPHSGKHASRCRRHHHGRRHHRGESRHRHGRGRCHHRRHRHHKR
jgi:hypothetical protein